MTSRGSEYYDNLYVNQAQLRPFRFHATTWGSQREWSLPRSALRHSPVRPGVHRSLDKTSTTQFAYPIILILIQPLKWSFVCLASP
jgi:hypothetical protein